MNRNFILTGFLCCLVVLLFFASVNAAEEFPKPVNDYLNDFASVFTPEQATILHTILQNVRQETTSEVVVVTLETTAPDTPGAYRTKLFSAWGIGKKDKDNGLLILYAKQEKRIEVEVGYGLEGILPDSKVGRLLDETYVPLRDAGNVSEGIVSFVQTISAELLENKEEIISGKSSAAGSRATILLIAFFIILFVVIVIFSITKKSNVRSKRDTSTGIKKDIAFNIITYICTVLITAIFFAIGLGIIGIVCLFILPSILHGIRGVRCAVDGQRMKYIGQEGKYKKYRCSHGHIATALIAGAAGYYAGSGGFGGGGFGGGGFGGGGSGGGGAGR